ncbi:hypothetical protein L248_2357 [Schleiferilactobacillus shenzhenensis LY-73]|uniref:Uncharacterized protein n=1 Tax=Schleiferilactobacillus shenzhenensis LY-73 TaxID=1231336 RepID=U4TLC9_9LACO|nr:hypothetical protein L248_2357 [Schleiferilactobacillus shenzhenensis LY-73]
MVNNGEKKNHEEKVGCQYLSGSNFWGGCCVPVDILYITGQL